MFRLGSTFPLHGDVELREFIIAPGTRTSHGGDLGCGRPCVWRRWGAPTSELLDARTLARQGPGLAGAVEQYLEG